MGLVRYEYTIHTKENTMNTKNLADMLNTDAKTLRLYLRAIDAGKDAATGRYSFTEDEAAQHAVDFPKWDAARKEPKLNENGTYTITGGYNVSQL